MMKKLKIADTSAFMISSNDYEDENCSVCKFLKDCEEKGRNPSLEEIERVMKPEKLKTPLNNTK